MPKKVPVSLLTPEQALRRERNLRYRQKQKVNPVGHPEIASATGVSYRTHTNPIVSHKNPQSRHNLIPFIAKLCLLGAIVVLLTYFQTQTYLEMGMPIWEAVAISAVCEGSLAYLSLSLRHSFVSASLFVLLFLYTLGTMSYGIKNIEALKTNEVIHQEDLRDTLDKTRVAFDLASEKRESGAMGRHLKSIQGLTDKLDKTLIAQPLIRFQSYWLISLRAILMLVSAFLVHKVGIRLAKDGIIAEA